MMKYIVVFTLAFLLAACGEAAVDAVELPPVPEMTAPEVVEEPVVEPVTPPVTEPVDEPVEEEPVDEPVEEDPVTEDEEPVTETVDDEPEEEETTQTTVFNAQTLANYDGREGRAAYIAIDGVVYDVTSSPRWPNGQHNGFQAGQDLSRQIPQNHRADMRFERFPVVGTYE
jgi:predicted heme/steroid binding protein